MGHGKEEHPAFHMAVVNRIVDGARSQARFATRAFPRRLLDARCLDEMLLGLPSQEKAVLEAVQGS